MIIRHPHSPPCFEEIDEAVTDLTDLMVVFGAKSGREVSLSSVVYNFDYLNVHLDVASFEGLRIWDFSSWNVRRWGELGFSATHVPVGYHPSMWRFVRRLPGKRDVDVAFFGSHNPRRNQVIQALRSFGVRVHYGYGETRQARDEILARSRLGLNMLYYEHGSHPWLRTAHLVANCVPMVSEDAPECSGLGVRVPYENLVPTIRALLRKSDVELDTMARSDLELFRAQPMMLPVE